MSRATITMACCVTLVSLASCASATSEDGVIRARRIYPADFERTSPVAVVSHPPEWVIDPGVYVCTVEQKASIEAIHLEDAPPPQASASQPGTRFRILVSAPEEGYASYRVDELEYVGPDRDQTEWHTPATVLHGYYFGSGERFNSVRDQAFLRFAPAEQGAVRFWHAGFEYAGGEDTSLSVRSGSCVPESA